jgi:hypothetical protein
MNPATKDVSAFCLTAVLTEAGSQPIVSAPGAVPLVVRIEALAQVARACAKALWNLCVRIFTRLHARGEEPSPGLLVAHKVHSAGKGVHRHQRASREPLARQAPEG